jgi:hypothetical protein
MKPSKLLRVLSFFFISILSGVLLSTLTVISPVAAIGVTLTGSYLMQFVPELTGVAYSLLFTAPGGAATAFSFNTKGLPQFLTWNNVVALTSLKIETQEDGVLHDWVAASIAVENGYMILGQQAANIMLMRLANGYLANKNVTISGVTSGAGTVGFYGASDNIGTFAYKSSNAKILALQPTSFDNFTAIWVPTMAAVTDRCEIVYRKGHKQTYNINDLSALSSLYQETPQIMVNNANAYIHTATFTCAADSAAYILSIKV